jgi:hypothetical protein
MYRRLRRRVLTPNISSTKLDVRGFYKRSPEAQDRLETVGRSFLAGYGAAAEAEHVLDAETPLEAIPVTYRGFAYEGAAMGFAIRDGMPLGGTDHVREYLSGRAANHIYMAYVGVGWAMARLPRMRWSGLHAPDPILRWLVLDGYGFHQAYFQTRRYVWEQYCEPRFPWPSPAQSAYATRAIDQGIGRACWFVGGTDVEVVASLLDRFAEFRRPDVWAGAGLAASYAGGASQEELEKFWELAGQYQPQLAQGAAFAAGARVLAGLVVPQTELATKVFCGMTPDEAANATLEAVGDLPEDAAVPAFEVWRQRIQDACSPRQQC